MQFHNFNERANKNLKKDDVMQWHMQSRNITTNPKVIKYFILPDFSTTRIVTWGFHVDDSTTVRYDVILVRDIFKRIIIKTKKSELVIDSGDGLFERIHIHRFKYR